jgi:hypothetical protein
LQFVASEHHSLPEVRPAVRPARRLVAVTSRPERLLAIAAAIILVVAFTAYDVSGIWNMQIDPVTGVDYIPAVQFVAERKKPGQKVLVALPPPAYLALGSTDDMIFLSSPLARKRAQRYTRLTADGTYKDYWTGVESIVDTAGLCRLLQSDPDLIILVDRPRLAADWAFKGTMATVLSGMTYVRYQADGGALVLGVAPSPSHTVRAEELCAQALTGNIDENTTEDGSVVNPDEVNDVVAEPTASN